MHLRYHYQYIAFDIHHQQYLFHLFQLSLLNYYGIQQAESNELVFDIEEYRAQSTNSKGNTLGIPEETLELSPDQAKSLEIIPERCT